MTRDESNLLIGAFLVLWLLPCAIQDYRRRRVSNWLTVPLFFAAWPAAIILGTWPLTWAVFVGTYTAWKLQAGIGAADGKLAVALAAFSPQTLLIGFALQMGIFSILRCYGRSNVSLAGAIWFYIAACLALLIAIGGMTLQVAPSFVP